MAGADKSFFASHFADQPDYKIGSEHEFFIYGFQENSLVNDSRVILYGACSDLHFLGYGVDQKLWAADKVPMKVFEVGKPCIAVSDLLNPHQSKGLYRGEILSIQELDVWVKFVDYGMWYNVSKNEVFEIPEELVSALPAAGMKLTVADVHAPNGAFSTGWKSGSSAKFINALDDCLLVEIQNTVVTFLEKENPGSYLGKIFVGNRHLSELFIHNKIPCSVTFDMEVEQEFNYAFEFSDSAGELPSEILDKYSPQPGCPRFEKLYTCAGFAPMWWVTNKDK